MGIRYMCKEREDNLIEIHVCGHGCIEGIYNCEGRFDTSHVFSDGFSPDDGWYRIADYTISQLKFFKDKNIKITYSDTCDDVEQVVNGC